MCSVRDCPQFIIVLYIYPIILQLYSIFCPESMSHKNNIFQWKEHRLRNRSLKCQPSTSFWECFWECLYTINKLNNILSFYIGNETNFLFIYETCFLWNILRHSKTEYGFYSNKTNFICVYQTMYMHILLLIY